MQQMWSSSHIAGGNVAYVEELYEQYLRDPDSVDVQWRDYFEQLPPVNGVGVDVSHSAIQAQFQSMARQPVRPIIQRTRAQTGPGVAIDQCLSYPRPSAGCP